MENTQNLNAIKGLLMIIIFFCFIFGLAVIAFGAYTSYLGSTGNTVFTFFGQSFKSTHVGIAAIFLGVSLMFLTTGRVLKTIDKTIVVDNDKQTVSLQNTGKELLNLPTTRIVLHLSKDLQKLNISFGLLHVRDGKDEVPDSGPLLNKEIYFKEIDRLGTLEAEVISSQKPAFQFKCFVDFKPYEYDDIKVLLEKNNFTSIDLGKGKPFRIWFILPGYSTYTTVDGILNNFFYPS